MKEFEIKKDGSKTFCFESGLDANTRLIAAAYDLLAACKLAKQKQLEGHSVPTSLIEACEAAIAKAEGKE